MSIDLASVGLAFLVGMLLGAGYMAVLWGSVRRLAHARHPMLYLLTGAVMRIGLILGAFYLVMDGRWERLLACFAGFLLVRIAVTRWASAARPAAPGH